MLAEQGIDMKKLKLAALMENQETIKRSVSKGMGVTILSKLAAEEELKMEHFWLFHWAVKVERE